MRKAVLSILILSVIYVASAQSVRTVNNIPDPGTDSSVIIHQWIQDAVSFSKNDSAKAEEYFFRAIRAANRNNDNSLVAEAKLSELRVLIVEDEPIIAENIGMYLP